MTHTNILLASGNGPEQETKATRSYITQQCFCLVRNVYCCWLLNFVVFILSMEADIIFPCCCGRPLLCGRIDVMRQQFARRDSNDQPARYCHRTHDTVSSSRTRIETSLQSAPAELQMVRSVRRTTEKSFTWPFGNWDGEMSARFNRQTVELSAFVKRTLFLGTIQNKRGREQENKRGETAMISMKIARRISNC